MIAVGVDTHKHRHVAAALNQLGQLLGEISVAASAAGYRELVSWLAGLGGEMNPDRVLFDALITDDTDARDCRLRLRSGTLCRKHQRQK